MCIRDRFLSLRYSHTHPDILSVSTEEVLLRAAKLGLLETAEGDTLVNAHRLYSNVTQMLRLTLDEGANPDEAAEGVKRRIAAAADLPDFLRLQRDLGETRGAVRRIFNSVLSL